MTEQPTSTEANDETGAAVEPESVPTPGTTAGKGSQPPAADTDRETLAPVDPVVEADQPSVVEAEGPAAVEADQPPVVEADQPPAVEADQPPAVEADQPPAVEAEEPAAVQADQPSAVDVAQAPSVQPDEADTVPAAPVPAGESEQEPSAPAAPEPEPAPTSEPAPGPEPVSEAVPAPEPAAAPEPTPVTPASKPTPGPAVPRPRPVPRPAARPVGAPAAPVAPVAPPVDAHDAAEAAAWGRVDEDGTVWVREEAGERSVGQYPGADREEALAFYVRRFLDLQAQVALFEARLPLITPKEIDQTLATLDGALKEPTAVGDVDGLRRRVEALRGIADERRKEAAAEREAARAQATAERTVIVEKAEKIAAQDAERTQWKQSGERLRELLDEWKTAQRSGPRLDRPTEDALWKRFSHARTAFDRHRRQYFSELDATQSKVKAAKEKLIARANELSTSTDWGRTAAAYRELMEEWKAAGRASRKEDDALWARFRAAQQTFFDARSAQNAEIDAEYGENLTVKEALLAQAEALLPVTDPRAARAALRVIQDKWDEAGKVPRADVQRVEGRMRDVEQAVRTAEDAAWNRSNPEHKARAEGAAAQLSAAIRSLEEDLEKAQAGGDAAQIAEAEAALEARRSWLEQIERTANG